MLKKYSESKRGFCTFAALNWAAPNGAGGRKAESTDLGVNTGEVSEWLKEHAWKVCILERVSRVRIPPSPQTKAYQCPAFRPGIFRFRGAWQARLPERTGNEKTARSAALICFCLTPRLPGSPEPAVQVAEVIPASPKINFQNVLRTRETLVFRAFVIFHYNSIQRNLNQRRAIRRIC